MRSPLPYFPSSPFLLPETSGSLLFAQAKILLKNPTQRFARQIFSQIHMKFYFVKFQK